MNKYNKRTVFNYVYGYDIEDFDINELENNTDFMLDVINMSNDKNFYNLCSNKVKKDYKFVKNIIFKFKDDKKFIFDVSDYFLDNSKDFFNRLELLIIMQELTTVDDNKILYISNKHCLDSLVLIERAKIEVIKQASCDDKELYNEIGMGFLVILDSFGSSKIILDYFAKILLNAIFLENKINLTEYFHTNFKNSKNIDKIQINKFLIDFINNYDSSLASYLSTNIHLLGDLRNEIERIKSNWNKYIENVEKIKYEIIIEYVLKYMENEGFNSSFIGIDILYFIGNELGILDKILKYDEYANESYEKIIENLSYINKDNLTLNDLKHYNHLKKYIINVLTANKIDLEEEGYLLKKRKNNKYQG